MNKNIKFQIFFFNFFLNFIFAKILKTQTVTLCSKALYMKYNHQFCFICEIVEDRFSAGLPKSLYFVCKSFSLRYTEKVLKQTMFRT